MNFTELLDAAAAQAPTGEIAAEIQAIKDRVLGGGAHTNDSGGNGPGPVHHD
jgi:hypothetical protein